MAGEELGVFGMRLNSGTLDASGRFLRDFYLTLAFSRESAILRSPAKRPAEIA
jgi:hypothetical protein